jgi:hypothetical protein
VDTNIVRDARPEVPARHDKDRACYGGWEFITYEDEHGEEREASYRCRRCNSEATEEL